MIQFQNVSYTYPGSKKRILADATFTVGKGDFAVLKGATGAGKSTIFQLLTCQATASEGTINVGPFELTEMKKNNIAVYRRSIGCVFQDFKLLEEKTVAENVGFALEVQRKFRRDLIEAKVAEVLERVGMSTERDHFPRELSLGGRQRVAIARALVTEPLVLVADGATAQLDYESAQGIYGLLIAESIRGMTILLTMTTDNDFRVFPRSAKYFQLQSGKVDEFLPVF